MIWHWKKLVTLWYPINKTTCLSNFINNPHKSKLFNKSLWWNRTSLTMSRRKAHKSKLSKKNKLKLICKHLTNTSHKKMVTTSRSLTKWRMNKWAPQWCQINKIKKNKKKNNNNKKLINQPNLNHTKSSKILNNKKLTLINWINNKKITTRTTSVTLTIWLLKKWVTPWSQTISKILNISSKNTPNHLLKL